MNVRLERKTTAEERKVGRQVANILKCFCLSANSVDMGKKGSVFETL